MKNEYKVEGNVVTMGVQEKQVIFNLADFPAVDRFGSWKLSRGASIYADFRHEGKMCKITLHKLLTESTWVKWLNGNTFDFRRENLQPIEKQIRAMAYGGFPFTPNKHRIEDGVVVIRVKSKTEEAVTFVDLEDYALVSEYKWNVNPVSGYVQCTKQIGKVNRHFYMHRLIMGAEDFETKVDHISGDKLDNRRGNLRLCGQSENAHNSYKHRDGTVGVSQTYNGHWVAQLKIGDAYHRRTFITFDAAADQYRQWQKEFNPSGLGELLCQN
jgi:hypothetical protein